MINSITINFNITTFTVSWPKNNNKDMDKIFCASIGKMVFIFKNKDKFKKQKQKKREP